MTQEQLHQLESHAVMALQDLTEGLELTPYGRACLRGKLREEASRQVMRLERAK